jgi:hypothetical protein
MKTVHLLSPGFGFTREIGVRLEKLLVHRIEVFVNLDPIRSMLETSG